MLSRVADAIYWLNRYVERAENYARFIGVNFNLTIDLPPNVEEQWNPLLVTTTDDVLFYQHYDAPTRENVIYFMTFDERNPNSIYSCLSIARENARTVRETISKEMWENLNQLYLDVKELRLQNTTHWEMSQVQDFCTKIKNGTQLFFGIIDSTITRNEAWHFGRLGRFLEQTDKTSRFLDVQYFNVLPNTDIAANTFDMIIWASVLKSASAYNMYRRHYQGITPTNIVEFLLFEKLFPRSMYYGIRQVEVSLNEILGYAKQPISKPQQIATKLRLEIENTEIGAIFEVGLSKYLDEFQQKNNSIGTAIFEEYFY